MRRRHSGAGEKKNTAQERKATVIIARRAVPAAAEFGSRRPISLDGEMARCTIRGNRMGKSFQWPHCERKTGGATYSLFVI